MKKYYWKVRDVVDYDNRWLGRAGADNEKVGLFEGRGFADPLTEQEVSDAGWELAPFERMEKLPGFRNNPEPIDNPEHKSFFELADEYLEGEK